MLSWTIQMNGVDFGAVRAVGAPSWSGGNTGWSSGGLWQERTLAEASGWTRTSAWPSQTPPLQCRRLRV